MRIITVKIDGKTYAAAALSTGVAREAVRTMEELDSVRRLALKLGEESGPAEILASVRARLRCEDREIALICRVFGGAFTPDALSDNLSRADLDALTAQISGAVGEIAAAYAPPGGGSGTDQTAGQSMEKLYHTLATKLRWPVSQIDAADFESLMSFVFYRDPDVRWIGGREYRRARGLPSWL